MKSSKLTLTKLSVLAFSIVLLPGCDFLKKGTTSQPKDEKKAAAPAPAKPTAQANGRTLCTINGSPVIGEDDFKKNVNQMLQSNPYFKGAGADILPMAIKRKLFDELVKQELIIADASARNLYTDPDFIKAYENMVDLVKRSLAVQFFEKRIYDKIDVSDSEVSKHYADNKQRFVKAAGGILVNGAKFSSEAQAKQFLAKAEKEPKNFEKLAQAEKGCTLKNFGRVSKESAGIGGSLVPAPIKEAALSKTSFPAVEQVSVGKEIWVIAAQDKQDTVFFDLEEIKPQIQGMIKNNKFREELDKEIKQLKDTMTVNINEDYFQETKKDISSNSAAQETEKVVQADSSKKAKAHKAKNDGLSAAA